MLNSIVTVCSFSYSLHAHLEVGLTVASIVFAYN